MKIVETSHSWKKMYQFLFLAKEKQYNTECMSAITLRRSIYSKRRTIISMPIWSATQGCQLLGFPCSMLVRGACLCSSRSMFPQVYVPPSPCSCRSMFPKVKHAMSYVIYFMSCHIYHHIRPHRVISTQNKHSFTVHYNYDRASNSPMLAILFGFLCV